MAEWFESWFDSPYYSLLYAHRDAGEAEGFVRRMAEKLPPRAQVLDAPCGNGRHARALAKLGFFVTGFDLSPSLLAQAQAFESPPVLKFFRRDLRVPFPERFDVVLNLFTGFGYLDDPADDKRVFANLVEGLRPGGIFILDFFNADRVRRNLVEKEIVFRRRVRFDVERQIVGDRVVKYIRVTDGDKVFNAEEKVRLYRPEDFRLMARELTMEYEWGDYNLTPFAADSPRYVLFARKSGKPGK